MQQLLAEAGRGLGRREANLEALQMVYTFDVIFHVILMLIQWQSRMIVVEQELLKMYKASLLNK